MYAITGITGQVGGAAARALRAAGLPVRGVLRDAAKGQAWAAQGCDLAVADLHDADALARAFAGAQAVFVLPPPVFDPAPGLPEARAAGAALRHALQASKVPKVVWLSTVGAQAIQPNLLSQHTLLEQALPELAMPVTVLRPAWFLENIAWDVAPARELGVLRSHLQPLDRAIPMVSADDVGRVAAGLLQDSWQGRRVVELEGPAPVSPREVAAALAQALGRGVRAEAVPRDAWEAQFRAQGMRNPLPRMQMLDGFNEGWLTFERAGGTAPRQGRIGLAQVLQKLVA